MINVSRVKVSKPRELPRCGTGGLHDEQQCCFDLGYKEGVAAARRAIRSALEAEGAQKHLTTAKVPPLETAHV